MSTYRIKEIFYTLQGEGFHAGRPAVFCRFSLCNLWTGREQDRHRAICGFCDTDFVGTDGTLGGVYRDADSLADTVLAEWPDSGPNPMVVCTGGEPLLQLDEALIEAFHRRGFYVAVETNGTQQPPHGIDWLCVSPKAGSVLVVEGGDELKLVHPQPGIDRDGLLALGFSRFTLQPLDDAAYAQNLAATIELCLSDPRWSLSLQTHKMIGVR